MRRIATTVAAVLTAAMALTGLTGLTAAAQADDGTVILSPAPGAEIDPGARTVTIQFASTDYYDVYVQGPGDYDENRPYDADAGETHTFNFSAFSTPGRYTITAYDSYYGVAATSTFTVLAPPMKVVNPAASPATFYPLVRDRFKDSTSIGYTLNRRAFVTAHVLRVADGRWVRHVDVGTQNAGRRHWTWNGLTSTGKRVVPGRYRIEIDAEAPDGTSSSTRTAVTARTSVVTKRVTQSRYGNRAATSHRGNCYTNRDSYSGEVTLDCWAGKWAQATYKFTIPTNAKNLSWRVRGEQNCCDSGQLTRTGKRTSARAFRVQVRVTYWRSYTVRRVSVSYTYRQRV